MCSNTSVFPRLYVNHVSRRTPFSHAVSAGFRPSHSRSFETAGFGFLSKFELLCKETKIPQFQSFGGIRAGFGSARRVSGGHEGRWVRWQSGAADAVRCGGQLREVQRCLRKSSPFTSFSLAFGKLTIKLEILCKETKCRQFQNLCEKTATQVQGLGQREPT